VPRLTLPLLGAAFLLLAATACGSSMGSSSTKTTAGTTGAATTAATTTGGAGAGVLVAEAASKAAGDIPDNQVFLTYHSQAGRWSMRYPEGWARTGSPTHTTFRDKNNLVRIVIQPGALPSTAQAHARVSRVHPGAAQRMTISGHPAVKVTYSTVSAPNPVTNRRVTLMVDRYYLAHGGRVAVVDLGTPVGVDNVDAYRMMIQSFTWR
jgi:hypothetical protein